MTLKNSQSVKYRRRRHSVFLLHAHLVFVTKYRRKVLTAEALDLLKAVFEQGCTEMGVCLESFEGERDHVHLLVSYPPKLAVSELVNQLKGESSRKLRKAQPDIARRYWNGVLWSPSYFATSCGGAPLALIRQYIEQQTRPA